MLTLDANIWVSAFDPREGFHAQSIAFLAHVARQGLALHGPATVPLEVACAMRRRLRKNAHADDVIGRLRAHPSLVLHPITDRLLDLALALGVERQLRGMDALYAATAALMEAPLISWDAELIQRAGAISPADWMAENAGDAGHRPANPA